MLQSVAPLITYYCPFPEEECLKEPRHTCTQKKPPVPARTDIPLVGCHTEKHFIKTVEIIPMKPRPAAIVDIKGYKQVLENSGLVPKYIKKKVELFLFFIQLSSSVVLQEWVVSVCAGLWSGA